MSKLIVLFAVLFQFSSCQAQNGKEKVNTQTVADYFLIEDVYINSYFVADKDLEDIYELHRDWVKLYFPTILKEYDLTLYSQFSIAALLYLEGEKSYLKQLWETHKRLVNENDFKPILNVLESYQIQL